MENCLKMMLSCKWVLLICHCTSLEEIEKKNNKKRVKNSQFVLTYISKRGYYGNVKRREERVDM